MKNLPDDSFEEGLFWLFEEGKANTDLIIDECIKCTLIISFTDKANFCIVKEIVHKGHGIPGVIEMTICVQGQAVHQPRDVLHWHSIFDVLSFQE